MTDKEAFEAWWEREGLDLIMLRCPMKEVSQTAWQAATELERARWCKPDANAALPLDTPDAQHLGR